MRLQVVGFQLDCASQRRLCIGKKSPPAQDVSEVAMRVDEARINLNGSAIVPLGLYQTAEIGERRARVVERARMSRIGREQLLVELESRAVIAPLRMAIGFLEKLDRG